MNVKREGICRSLEYFGEISCHHQVPQVSSRWKLLEAKRCVGGKKCRHLDLWEASIKINIYRYSHIMYWLSCFSHPLSFYFPSMKMLAPTDKCGDEASFLLSCIEIVSPPYWSTTYVNYFQKRNTSREIDSIWTPQMKMCQWWVALKKIDSTWRKYTLFFIWHGLCCVSARKGSHDVDFMVFTRNLEKDFWVNEKQYVSGKYYHY